MTVTICLNFFARWDRRLAHTSFSLFLFFFSGCVWLFFLYFWPLSFPVMFACSVYFTHFHICLLLWWRKAEHLRWRFPLFFSLVYYCIYVCFFFYTSCFAFQIRTAFFLTKRKKKNTKFLSKEKVGVLQKKEKRRRKKKRGVFVVASKRCATLGAFMHLSGSTTQTFTVISVFFFVCFLRVFPMHPLPRVFSHLFRAAHLCVSTPPSLNPLPFSCFFLLLCFCSFTF